MYQLRWARILEEREDREVPSDNLEGGVVQGGPSRVSVEGRLGDSVVNDQEGGIRDRRDSISDDDSVHDEPQIDNENNENNNTVQNNEKFISEEGIVDINFLKPTSLPYNPKVFMPRGLKQGEEEIHNLS